MNTIKILFIEDEEDQQGIFRDAVEVFNSKNDLTVEYKIARGIQEAEDKLNGSFDGAIIDLKLGDDERRRRLPAKAEMKLFTKWKNLSPEYL